VLALGDGSTVVVPGSLEVQLGGRLRLRRMSAAETYGGWLAASPVGHDQAEALIAFIHRGPDSTRWLLNPFLATELAPLAGPTTETHTLAIDLRPGYDELRRSWSKGHRAAPAQARRAGLSARLAVTEEDWSGYYAAYLDSLRRWGRNATSRYPWTVFQAFSRADPQLVRLWIAEADGEIVSGALCFYHPNQIVMWHAATLERAFAMRPANLLLDEAVRHACSIEARWFDLGPSGGHEGVERFKLGFGPVHLPVRVFDHSTRTVGMIRGLRMALRRGRRLNHAMPERGNGT
jgi:hypothetical protein